MLLGLLWIGSCGDPAVNQTTQPLTRVSEFIKPDLNNLGQMIQDEINMRHEAIQRLENSSERNISKLAQAYGTLAMLYQAFGFPQQAQYLFQNAIELAPQHFKWQYLLAHAYQARQLDEDAKLQFQKALELDEFHVPSLLALGEYARQASDVKEATTYFNNALLLKKDAVYAKLGLAQIAMEDKDFKRAAELMDEALQVQPNARELHYQAAMAYRGLADREKSQYHLDQQQKSSESTIIHDPIMEQVSNLSKQDRTFVERGNRALADGNYQQAAKHFQNAMLINPSSGETRAKLATCLLHLGDLDQAKIEFENADRLRPGNVQIALKLADIALQQKKYPEAKKQLLRALEKKDAFAAAHLKLAVVYLQNKEFQLALDQYQRVIELEPTNPTARVERALMLIRLQRYVAARATLEADLIQFPSHSGLGVLLIKVLSASPQADVRDGKRALVLVHNMSKTGKTLELLEAGAMAFAETGAFEEAVNWQEQALARARERRPEHVIHSEDILKTYKNREPCRVPLPLGL